MSIADARRDARQAERLLTVNEAAVKLGVKRCRRSVILSELTDQ